MSIAKHLFGGLAALVIVANAASCATPQSGRAPKPLTPEGRVIAKSRKRAGAEGDYRVRTASVSDRPQGEDFVLGKQQDINVNRDGARYFDMRITDTDRDGFADALCVVSGQFFSERPTTVDEEHCRELPSRTVPMKIPLESAVEFVNTLENQ